MTIGHVKSIDFASHGAIGAQLTNAKIDKYILEGRYGEKRKQELLELQKKKPKRKKKLKKIDVSGAKKPLTKEQIKMLEKIGLTV